MDHQLVSQNQIGTALLVGTDEVLLYTRRVILEKQGFAISTSTPTDAVDKLRKSSFDLVVACHTLCTEEADQIVLVARAGGNRPALISFSKQMSPEPTTHPFDGNVWSLASPETFISKVHEVLRNRLESR